MDGLRQELGEWGQGGCWGGGGKGGQIDGQRGPELKEMGCLGADRPAGPRKVRRFMKITSYTQITAWLHRSRRGLAVVAVANRL